MLNEILEIGECQMFNDYGMKSNSELSEYQKRIENIENVILCVSEVEKMVSEIGSDLTPEDLDIMKKRPCSKSRGLRPFVGIRSGGNNYMRKRSEDRDTKRRIAKIMYISDEKLLASDLSLHQSDSKT